MAYGNGYLTAMNPFMRSYAGMMGAGYRNDLREGDLAENDIFNSGYGVGADPMYQGMFGGQGMSGLMQQERDLANLTGDPRLGLARMSGSMFGRGINALGRPPQQSDEAAKSQPVGTVQTLQQAFAQAYGANMNKDPSLTPNAAAIQAYRDIYPIVQAMPDPNAFDYYTKIGATLEKNFPKGQRDAPTPAAQGEPTQTIFNPNDPHYKNLDPASLKGLVPGQAVIEHRRYTDRDHPLEYTVDGVGPNEQAVKNAQTADNPADDAKIAKMIYEYRMQMPTGYAIRDPAYRHIIAMVEDMSRAPGGDPFFTSAAFSQSNYEARRLGIDRFTSGVPGQQVRSFNVFTGHLDLLRQAGEALNNNDLNTANYWINKLKSETGDGRITTFDTAMNYVAAEGVRAVQGSPGAEPDRERVLKVLQSKAGPKQIAGFVKANRDFATEQLLGLEQQYNAAMNFQGEMKSDFRKRFLNKEARTMIEPDWMSPAKQEARRRGLIQ